MVGWGVFQIAVLAASEAGSGVRAVKSAYTMRDCPGKRTLRPDLCLSEYCHPRRDWLSGLQIILHIMSCESLLLLLCVP